MKEYIFKHKLLFTFLIILAFSFILLIRPSYCADIDIFNAWVEENKEELNIRLDGYEYVIINNYWQNYVGLYVTNAPNTKFYFLEKTPITR